MREGTSGLGLPALQSPGVYGCAPASTSQAVNSSGYIPVNFAGIPGGSPFGALPVDPINTSSSGNYYTFAAQSGQYELTGLFESSDNKQGGVNDKVSPSGGQSALYTIGSSVTLTPLATNKGLVGYWKFDEGTGSTALDSSGNNSSGTWSGTPAYIAGKVGPYAGSFNGSSYASVPSNAQLNVGASDFSVSFWFKNTTSSLGSSFWNIVSKKNSPNTSDIGWMFWFRNMGGEGLGLSIRFNNGATNDVMAGSGTDVTSQIADGGWHYVVASVSRGAGTVSFYSDSVNVGLVGSVPSGNFSTAEPLGLAASGGGNYPVPSGFVLDDVRIYNRALSAAEIRAIYNSTK